MSFWPTRLFRASIPCAAAFLSAAGGTAGAQIVPTPPDTSVVQLERTQDIARHRVTTPGSRTLLEGPVSRTEYILGPGDVLTLSLFGFRSQILTLEVAPEGTIVVPEVGVFPVGGLNIEQAERLATERIRRFYTDVEVNLTLSSLRSFKVFLVGNVPAPGSREATAVTRISELVRPENADGVIHRNIVIRRANGRSMVVDLASFLRTGDLDDNPTLREGDVIHVPPVDRTISVSGRVAFPGVYEYRDSESLAELLTLANGGGRFPADAADTVRVQRSSDDSDGAVTLIPRDAAIGRVGMSMMLEPFDALYIPRFAHYKERTTATVAGEVARPGEYPIEPGVTAVDDLVRMAGGLTSRASFFNALLRREPVEVPATDQDQLETIPPEMLSRDELRVLQVTNRGDASSVVLDLGELAMQQRSTEDVPLQDGDRLYVPELRNEIIVMGAVMRPGIVQYQAGQPIEYFVDVAGGYTRRADRSAVSVLKGRRGNRLGRRDVLALEPGDRIVVPFSEPKTFLERVQTVEGVVSTVSGLLLAVVALDRLW